MTMNLNERAIRLCDQLKAEAERLRVGVRTLGSGTTIIDCGVEVAGGIEAGLLLARVCLADLADVTLVPAAADLIAGPAVQVTTDQPLAACIGSQYAGWQIAAGKFFAMGSGPMRAVGSREPIFDEFPLRETATAVVGVLESRKLPGDDVCLKLAEQCDVAPEKLTLLVAPTASLAGSIQVVARSVETALHKLHELGFDLRRVTSGFGVAPLPTIAADDLTAIGRTNDAILYGGEVTLWVRGDDASVQAIGPRVPSSASADFGKPFAAIFEHYGRDFYRIDKHLFSPAAIAFCNLDTGHAFRFGQTHPRVVHESFGVQHS